MMKISLITCAKERVNQMELFKPDCPLLHINMILNIHLSYPKAKSQLQITGVLPIHSPLTISCRIQFTMLFLDTVLLSFPVPVYVAVTGFAEPSVRVWIRNKVHFTISDG